MACYFCRSTICIFKEQLYWGAMVAYLERLTRRLYLPFGRRYIMIIRSTFAKFIILLVLIGAGRFRFNYVSYDRFKDCTNDKYFIWSRINKHLSGINLLNNSYCIHNLMNQIAIGRYQKVTAKNHCKWFRDLDWIFQEWVALAPSVFFKEIYCS